MPLLLGSVNRHWRSVSLGLSSLWSFIAISSTRPLEQELWRAVIWLERSKRHPLTVFVDFEDTKRLEEDSGEPADLTPIYDLLLPHFDRWREVIIKVNAPSLLSAFKKFRDNQTQPLGRRLILSKKHVQARLWRYHLQKVMDKGRDTPPEVCFSVLFLCILTLTLLSKGDRTFGFCADDHREKPIENHYRSTEC